MSPSLRNVFIGSAGLSWIIIFFLLPASYSKIGQHADSSPTFKLHAWHTEVLDGTLLPDRWRPAPRVNPDLVNQIKTVRTNLPNWSGVHHMIPGGHAK